MSTNPSPKSFPLLDALSQAECLEIDGVHICYGWGYSNDCEVGVRFEVSILNDRGEIDICFHQDGMEKAVFNDGAWQVEDTDGGAHRLRFFTRRELTGSDLSPLGLLDAEVVDRYLNQLIVAWRERCDSLGYRPDQRIERQFDFFTGALHMFDFMGQPNAAVSPRIIIPLMASQDLYLHSPDLN